MALLNFRRKETPAEPVGASPRATGEPVGAPTLVVYESACIHPELLRLMVVHPLEPDERFTVYDGVGRPTALFAGTLEAVPEAMPISEELALPEELGEGSVARYVYAEDRARLEALVLRGEGIFDPEASLWHRHVSLPALRLLADSGRPPAQCELLALVLAVGAGALALVHSWPTLVLAALSLLAGVQIALVTPALRRLRAPSSSEASRWTILLQRSR